MEKKPFDPNETIIERTPEIAEAIRQVQKNMDNGGYPITPPSGSLSDLGKDMMDMAKKMEEPKKDKSTWVAFGVEPIEGVEDPHITIAFLGKGLSRYFFNDAVETAKRMVKAMDTPIFEVASVDVQEWGVHRVVTVNLPVNVLEATYIYRQTLFADRLPISMKFSLNPHVTVGNIEQGQDEVPYFGINRLVTSMFVQSPYGRVYIPLDYRKWEV